MARYRWIEPDDGSRPPGTGNELLAAVLARRGITGDDAVAFLCPDLGQISAPSRLPGLTTAVELTRDAIARGRRIAVFGDYDADGVSSTAILTRALRRLGADVVTFLPHRFRDGYGLNPRLAGEIARSGASLLITVDCGTGNAAELAAAREQGVEAVVVVDHHQVHRADVLGVTEAFISPHHPDSTYPFAGLAASGLAYQLARALIDAAGRADPSQDDALLTMAAVGTVADVVPLRGENRVIVSEGLARFAAAAPVGLQALARQADIDPAALTSWHIGFNLGPRLNAAGRMGDAQPALDLLLTDDPHQAAELARQLGRLNALRQQTTERMLREAEEQIRRQGDPMPPVLLLANDAWSIGLVGLVAGRLVDRYYRPTVVLSRDRLRSRGSARSIEGFDIAKAFAACDDLLEAHGGHSRAAGLTVATNHLPELERRLRERADAHFDGQIPAPALLLDAELAPAQLRLETEALVAALEPFGEANPAPIFFTRGLTPLDIRPTREDKHVMFRVARDGYESRAIFFHGGPRLGELRLQRQIDLAYRLKRDTWQGRTRLSLEVVDFRSSAAAR